MSKKTSIQTLISKLEKNYGQGCVNKGQAVSAIPRIRSGIFILDILTGGGLPCWKYTCFCGGKSTSKTSTALRFINGFLNKYPDLYVGFIDAEQSFDKSWASNFISKENFDRIVVILPDYGEQCVDIAVELYSNPKIGFVVIDSLATMIPVADAQNSAIEDTVGSQAKLINKLFRKTLPILSQAYKQDRVIYSLFINQPTGNISAARFASPYKKTGSILQDLLYSLDLRFYNKEIRNGVGTYTFAIEKSKIPNCLQKSAGQYKMYLKDTEDTVAGSVDDLEPSLKILKENQILNRISNGWEMLDKTYKNLSEVGLDLETIAQGKKQLLDKLENLKGTFRV